MNMSITCKPYKVSNNIYYMDMYNKLTPPTSLSDSS